MVIEGCRRKEGRRGEEMGGAIRKGIERGGAGVKEIVLSKLGTESYETDRQREGDEGGDGEMFSSVLPLRSEVLRFIIELQR